MPQARMRTSTSVGPADGVGTSATSVVPGPVTMTVFIFERPPSLVDW